jgi:hypothetical protein
MFATTHIVRAAAAAAAAAVTALGLAGTALAGTGTYGWPVKPFNVQHPVRGFFGDPRIAGHDEAHGTLHFGIDIVAPNGTAVYATLDGVASIHPLHRDTVIVSGAGGVAHEYWHVVPAIRPGQRVVAYRTIVGHVEKPWAHVHFSERIGSRYLNPLRPGALTPYRDTTRPTVHLFSFERDGAAVGRALSGRVDVVVEAWDDVPVAVAAPWNDKPVLPALVEWRILARGTASVSATWHVADDFRTSLPTVPFSSVYAQGTRQNHPRPGSGTGRYRLLLARGWDTHTLPNGTYHLEVAVSDTRGNTTHAAAEFTVAN